MRQRILAGIFLSLTTLTSNAALLGRLPTTQGGTDYQAYYDTDLNITWQANANLTRTQSFGIPTQVGRFQPSGTISTTYGELDWYTAQTWLAAMNSANYLGFSDWRFPLTQQPDSTCEFHNIAVDPVQGYGHGCRGSEFGHLFQVEGVSIATAGPFTGVLQNQYWSSTTTTSDPSYAWTFAMTFGEQYGTQKINQPLIAWAVRNGDVAAAVPIPAVGWLLAPAFGVLGWMRRRRC